MEFLRHGLWSYGWCLLFERSNVVHIFLVINCQLISEKYRFWFYGKPEVVAPWHMPTWHQSARARLLLPSVDRLQLPTVQLFALTQVPTLQCWLFSNLVFTKNRLTVWILGFQFLVCHLNRS